MADVPDLRTRVREKVRSGKLPSRIPEKLGNGFGDGHTCDACDEKIHGAQIEYHVDLPDGGFVRLHIGCSGLWQAELLRAGAGREPVMSTPTAAVSALILDRALCLGCLGARVGATYDAVRRALVAIEKTVQLYRDENGVCRGCWQKLPVYWLRFAPRADAS
jgi:hypothetical protein